MAVENFNWDNVNQVVSWTYNGKTVNKIYKNMNYAGLVLQDNYVLVIVGNKLRIKQGYYLSFEGKEFFSFDMVNGSIRWQLQDHLVQIGCKSIESAHYYVKYDIIMVIATENKTDKVLKGYSLDGTLLFVKQPPQGYIFYYLNLYENQPAVVCDGGKANADAYGRSSFNFIINTETGDMSKVCLVYE